MADVNKSIEFTLRAQTAQLEASLRKIPGITDKEAREMVKKLDKSFDKVEKRAEKAAKNSKKSFSGMANGIGAAATAVGGLSVALFSFSKMLTDSINELQDLSTTTGLSVSNLHSLRLAAAGSGLEMGVLAAGLQKLPSVMQAAAKGSKTAADAFDRLGVDATDADGQLRDANAVFEESIEALAGISSSAEQAALAADLFGTKAGAALIQSGAIGAMQAYNDLTREFAVSTGPAAAKEAAAMQRNLASLEEVAMGAGQQLLQAFGGGEGGVSMSSVINEITSAIVYMSSIVGDVGEVVSAQFQAIFSPIMAVSLLMEGKTSQAIELLREGFSNAGKEILDLGSSFERAGEKAARFEELQSKINQGAGGADSGAGAGVARQQAITKELEKQVDLEALKNQMLQIQTSATGDLLTKEEQITQKYQAQLEKLETIAATSEGQINTEMARFDVINRMERELFELKMGEIDQQLNLQIEAHEKEMERIDEQKKARIDAITQYSHAVAGFASDFATAMQTTLENTGNLTAKSAKRLFRLQQAAGVSEIAINTAAAIMKALAVLGPVAGGIASGAIAALGATQVAAVMSESPPSFDMGGMVGGRSGPDVVQGQLLSGEAVLDRATVRKVGGEEGVRRIQREGAPDSGVIVISPYKHFDRFVAGSMARSSRLRQINRPQLRGY